MRAGQLLQLTTVALLGLAVVMVHSASMTVDRPLDGASVLTSKHTLYAALAVLAMLIAARLNLARVMQWRGWLNPVPYLLVLAVALVGLTFVPGIGKTINGATRWIWLGGGGRGIMFQPSEVLKFVILIAIAWWCARRRGVMHTFRWGLLPALVVIGLACVMVVKHDFGTAALMAAVCCFLLLAGGARWWQLGLLMPPAAAGLAYAIISKPHRMQRIRTYLDPFADAEGAGYQSIQGMVAIVNGGPTGRGLGAGIQKFDYLPTDTSDMLFAVICEELGLVGAAVVIGLYILMLVAGLRILRQSDCLFSRLVALGVMLTIGLQALINLAVVTVLVPTKGIALPLLSAGGTGWIMTGFAIGLVASLDRDNETEVDESFDAEAAAIA